MNEFYISIDVETDGRCPLLNSMLQFGAVFYDESGTEVDSYCANLKPIEGAVQDPNTMQWWRLQEQKHPGILASMQQNQVPAEAAMKMFNGKVTQVKRNLGCEPVCFGYPVGFDFTWVYVYLNKFLGYSSVGFSAIDIKSLGMSLLDRPFRECTKRVFPKHWFSPKLKHTHNALDDAREQGHLFFQIKKEFPLRLKAYSAMTF